MVVQITTAYGLVRGPIEEVELTVNKMIAEQWQPLGPPFPVMSLDEFPRDEEGHLIRRTYDVCQAMIKQGFAMVNQPGSSSRVAVPTGMALGAGGKQGG